MLGGVNGLGHLSALPGSPWVRVSVCGHVCVRVCECMCVCFGGNAVSTPQAIREPGLSLQGGREALYGGTVYSLAWE